MKGYIYLFKNKINGKCYVGQTIYLKKRIAQHYTNIKHKTFKTPLYCSLRKHGRENFDVSVLVTIDCEKGSINHSLDLLEILFIEKYEAYTKGYNLTLGGDHSIRFEKQSEETRKRKSLASKRNWEKGIYANRDQSGDKSGLFGKHPNKETREKMRKAKEGMFFGEDNPFYGKTHSEESLKKISESRRGQLMGKDNPSARRVINLTTGKVFDTMQEAAAFYGIKSPWNISTVCSGKLKTTGGYRWAYAS